MKIKPRCIPCLLNRVLFESKLVTDDERKISYVMKNVLQKMASIYNEEKSSAEIATQIHGLAYKLLESKDPYKELKEKSNEIALQLLPKARKLIEDSNNKLETAILCSIAGNSIDFGIEGSASTPEELAIKFEEYIKEGLYINDIEKIKKYLKGEILYFTDNCGEIIFDKLVCEQLKKYDVHLSLICKRYPILTDATYEDVKRHEFDEIVDEIMTTGRYAVGIDFNGISEKLKEKLQHASLIICKGMANYEAFSESKYRPIAYLMRVKCKSIAEDVGIAFPKNIAKLYEK